MNKVGKTSRAVAKSREGAPAPASDAATSTVGHVHLWTITEQERKRFGQDPTSARADEIARIRAEIFCLLDHYTPAYDNRISQLIEKWQATGDPEYDPVIRVQHRMAHRRHARDTSLS